jgi:tetratricopeptide (TPR) repeat protein
MFLCLGLLLFFGHEFVVHSMLRAGHWADILYPHNDVFHAGFMAAAYFFLIPISILCLATASGLKRNKPWARWTGAAASSLLLFGFPVLTVAGGVGLYALFAKPSRPRTPSRPALGPPAKATDSKAQPFVFGITMFAGFQALALLTLYAQHNGLPAWNPGRTWWVYLFLFLFLQTALHELGHAAIAWSVYHKVRVFSVGPFAFWNDGCRRQFRVEWKRLLDANGYMGAVAISGDHLALKEVAIAAGGPFLSLASGALLLLVFLSLPGTRFQTMWWMIAFNAVLGLCYAAMSLVPFGNSDGAMLYHLVRGTPAGHRLLNQHKISLIREQADTAHSRADFQTEVELRRDALQLAREGAGRNSMAIALSHQALGHALLSMEDWPGSHVEFLKGLEFEAECALNPSLQANSWSGLQKACVERHSAVEAGRASTAAVKVIDELKRNPNRTSLTVTQTMLAQVHLRAGAYESALAEAAEALAILPPHRDCLVLRAMLHAVQAEAHLYLNRVDAGLAAAREAALILNSPEIHASSRNLAFDELGRLGEGLRRAGQPDRAIELMLQAAKQLEAGGASVAAAQYRIRLARTLRTRGRRAEALYMLPDEDTLPSSVRRSLLAERAELHLSAGQHRDAVADCRALLALWQAEANPAVPEIAAAEGHLARACLEAGDPAEAEALARQAAPVLTSWDHPGAASCRITLALVTREPSCAVFDDALRTIESHPLLSPTEKTRLLEAERARISRSGPVEGAATWERLVPVVCT